MNDAIFRIFYDRTLVCKASFVGNYFYLAITTFQWDIQLSSYVLRIVKISQAQYKRRLAPPSSNYSSGPCVIVMIMAVK